MKINISNIPTHLKETDRWVCWEEQMRDGKKTKIPKSPVDGVDFASTSDPDTWGSFSDAIKTLRNEEYDGVGFVFTTEGEYVGVDLDDCRDPESGEFQDWAVDIMETLDSFTEISPSGTGSHVIVKGSMPDGRKRRGDLEMYEDGRYFTVTGEVVSKHGALIDEPRGIVERTDELREVANEYLYENEDGSSEAKAVDVDVSIDEIETDPTAVGAEKTGSGELNGLPEEDQERLKKMFRRKRQAYELWHGSTAGYPSQSEADQALCNHLAYWLDKSSLKIDSAFRLSRLYRDKWDEVRYSDGSTYGEGTIKEAIRSTDSTYTSKREQGDGTEQQTTDDDPDKEIKKDQESEVDEDQTEHNEPDTQDQQPNPERKPTRSRARTRGGSRRTAQPESQGAEGDESPDEESEDGDAGVEVVEEDAHDPSSTSDRRRGRSRVDSLVPESESGSERKQKTTDAGANQSTTQAPDYDIPDPDDLDLDFSSGFPGRDEDGPSQAQQGDGNGSKSIFDPDSLQSQNIRDRQRGGRDGQSQSGQEQNGSQPHSSSQKRQSTNGKRQIPSATDERLREFGFKLDELEEKIGQIEVEHKNEHDMAQKNVQDTIDELRHYENVVDDLDAQLQVLSMLVESLCSQIGPRASEIASIARDLPSDPAEVPVDELNERVDQSGPSAWSDSSQANYNQGSQPREAREAENSEGGFFDALKNIGSRER